ncbi:MAG: glutathione S-transferase family protein [Proteobacteria bacterium]|nr:glutathione S-transferase family protein [Pseudomonadota bacterium]
MEKLVLYIGNRNYSSWSMRAWMALEGSGIPFEDVLIPFDFAAGNPEIKAISPTGLVPFLRHGTVTVWETLSIIEYAAELFPDAGVWPKDREARSLARSISAEMHAGFRALRGACPMNMRRTPGKIDLPDGVVRDVARIEAIWRDCLAKSGGPFLFGAFSAADAMFAPVVSRFETYALDVSQKTQDYMATMMAHPAWVKWRDMALAEPWVVPEDEP